MKVVVTLVIAGATAWWLYDLLVLGTQAHWLWVFPVALLSILSGKAITHWVGRNAETVERRKEADVFLHKALEPLIEEQKKFDECLANLPPAAEDGGEVSVLFAKCKYDMTAKDDRVVVHPIRRGNRPK